MAGNKKYSILIVEDDEGTRDQYKFFLERAGYRIHLAGSYLEAISILKEVTIDLAIIDVELDKDDHENTDGLRVLGEIVKLEKILPAILVSGYIDRIDDKSAQYAYGIHQKGDFQGKRILEVVSSALQSGVVVKITPERIEDSLPRIIGQMASEQEDIHAILDLLLKEIIKLINAEEANLSAVDGNELIVRAATSGKIGEIFDVEDSISGLAVRRQNYIYIPNIDEDEKNGVLFKPALGIGIKSELVIPLKIGLEVIALLNFESSEKYAFHEDEIQSLVQLAPTVAMTIHYALLHERLREQAQELANYEGMKRQGALAARLVHRVGNPIRNMRDWFREINTDAMSSLEQKFPDVALAISMIRDDINQLMNVVVELKIALHEATLKPKPTNVNNCINSALEDLKLIDKDAKYQIETHLFSELPLVFADENLIDVFRELLENSTDAMPSGGKIHIKTQFTNEKVEVRVEDTGRGIPPRALFHIFDPGYSNKDRATEADGLGLHWCKLYVESCKGTITVNSQTGEGTIFTILLSEYSDELILPSFI